MKLMRQLLILQAGQDRQQPFIFKKVVCLFLLLSVLNWTVLPVFMAPVRAAETTSADQADADFAGDKKKKSGAEKDSKGEEDPEEEKEPEEDYRMWTEIHFLPCYSEDELIEFINNDADNDFDQVTFDNVMGRVVIPSIGTDSPIYSVSRSIPTDLGDYGPYIPELDRGSGIVPLTAGPINTAKDSGQKYVDSIYIHRVLSKTTGALYIHELKEGDIFYVDNFSSGYRYFYRVAKNESVSVEEFWDRHPYYGGWDYGPMLSRKMLLVSCGPFKYGASEERVLVEADVIDLEALAEDSPGYADYLANHPKD